jgi:hypothetical protein
MCVFPISIARWRRRGADPDGAGGVQPRHRRGALGRAAAGAGDRDRVLRAGAGAMREHAAAEGPGRRTYGHSLAVAPWGEVLADGGRRRRASRLLISTSARVKRGAAPRAVAQPRPPFDGPDGRADTTRSGRRAVQRDLHGRSACPEPAESRVLPKGMELSAFFGLEPPRAEQRGTHARAARPAFHVTRGAMTNTLASSNGRGMSISGPTGTMRGGSGCRSAPRGGRPGCGAGGDHAASGRGREGRGATRCARRCPSCGRLRVRLGDGGQQ